jgi:hypothetical protein
MEADFNSNKKPKKQDQNAFAQVCACAISRLIRDESCEIPDPGDPEAMASEFLLESEVKEFPMNPLLIQKEQEKDKKLQQDIKKHVHKYKKRTIEGAEIVTHHKLIVIPKTLQNRKVAWYHHYLAHPGMTRLEATLRETMTWPNMRKDISSNIHQFCCTGTIPNLYKHTICSNWHETNKQLIWKLITIHGSREISVSNLWYHAMRRSERTWLKTHDMFL